MVEPFKHTICFLDITFMILPVLPMLGNITEARRALVSVDKRPSVQMERGSNSEAPGSVTFAYL